MKKREKFEDKFLMAWQQVCMESSDGKDYNTPDDIIEKLIAVFWDHEKKVFFIGNGGSAAIACHMTADFAKNGGKNTVSMYDPAMLTCLGNDYGYEYVFSKQIERQMEKGDILVAVSSSGNSPNIVKAIQAAKKCGGIIITLTGFKADNQCRSLGNYNLHVPCMEYGIVESIHNLILQQVAEELADRENN